MKIHIPLARPEITDADREAVMQVLRTPQLSMGPEVSEFEQAICDYMGCKFAVAVNSGTSALHLAIRALQIERGAEVILPSFTFSALLNVVLQEGLRPQFVDIEPLTFNTTPEKVAETITPQTRLIIAVHTYGFPVDVAAIAEIAEDKSGHSGAIHVIEDACEALGAEVRGRKAGTIGKAGLFAFYPNKQITTGEGGMLVTSDLQIASAAQRLRNQGRNPELGLNDHAEIGFSYRISDMNCALGISQLARIEEVVSRRQKLAKIYNRALSNIAEIRRPPLASPNGRISWFVYPVVLGSEFSAQDRDWLCAAMRRRGIATGRYFASLHQQPVFTRLCPGEDWSTRLPVTEAISDRVIALPFFNKLTEAEIHEVAGGLEESIRELRRKT